MKTGLSTSRIPYIAACGGKTWNIIEGCSNDASICSVRGLGLCWAEEIGHEGFAPRFNAECLNAPLRARRPTTIFTGFRSDLWSDKVDPDWRRQVFDVERQCPQHVFIHLTKCPGEIDGDQFGTPMTNRWFGVSITNGDWGNLLDLWSNTWADNHVWVSFEPVLSRIEVDSGTLRNCEIRFCVIGGLSDGAGRIVPPSEGGTRAEWVQPILDAAGEAGCKIYCKNLGTIWHDLINPRTGKAMQSPYELREIPQNWVAK